MIDADQLALGMSIAGLLICLANLGYMHIQGYTDKTNNRLFLVMLYLLTINTVCGIVLPLTNTEKLTSDSIAFIHNLFRYIYFLTHTALSPLFFFYTASIIGRSLVENKTRAVLKAIPFFVTEILVIINPLTHFVYTIDDQMAFHRNWGEALIYAAAVFYFVMIIILILFSWKVLTKKKKTTLILCFFIVTVGVLIQLFIPWLRVEVLFEAIGFTGTMVSLENEDDRMNASVGVYNRAAFGVDLEAALQNYKKLYMLVIRITNLDAITRMLGRRRMIYAHLLVSNYLKTVVPRYSIYSTNPGAFVLLLYHKNEEETDEIAHNIDNKFREPWIVGESEVPLSVVLMRTELPEKVKTVGSALYMADAPLPPDLDKTILEDDDLQFLLRRADVERAISRGLTEHSFEVYYQPTYYADGTLHGAEALLRMHDNKLGDIYPDEFIPLTEQMGLIDAVDDFVLREVCRFIRSGIPQDKGMDVINVNLSMMQCMKKGFAEHINSIVEREGVEKSFINFEITESVAATDYKLLGNVVHDLKKEGFLFSLDDYGTGFSNMNAVFSMNFDIIKIDKSILWAAEKSETGAIILENSVRMLSQMGKKILVEGVETEEQLELLRKLGVDFVQGYLFSKPIPEKEFIERIF
ncbi:MAG: GGDEF domain-containing protein [Eubacterium sp.]|nr:GGDEF domain-containing protein [Eubacterium sp.]